jgi:hypothetical protein
MLWTIPLQFCRLNKFSRVKANTFTSLYEVGGTCFSIDLHSLRQHSFRVISYADIFESGHAKFR